MGTMTLTEYKQLHLNRCKGLYSPILQVHLSEEGIRTKTEYAITEHEVLDMLKGTDALRMLPCK